MIRSIFAIKLGITAAMIITSSCKSASDNLSSEVKNFTFDKFICVKPINEHCDSWPKSVALQDSIKQIFMTWQVVTLSSAPVIFTPESCVISYQDKTQDKCTLKSYEFASNTPGLAVTQPIVLPKTKVNGKGSISAKFNGEGTTSTILIPISIDP